MESLPKDLGLQAYDKWWAMNIFRFLNLPFELRAMIVSFAMGPCARPRGYRCSDQSILRYLARTEGKVNRNTTSIVFAHIGAICKVSDDFAIILHIPMIERLQFLEISLSRDQILKTCNSVMFWDAQGFRFRNRPSRGDWPDDRWMLRAISANAKSLRRIRFIFPRVSGRSCQYEEYCLHDDTDQVSFCWNVWSVIKDSLTGFRHVDLGGHICDAEKQRFLVEHLAGHKQWLRSSSVAKGKWYSYGCLK